MSNGRESVRIGIVGNNQLIRSIKICSSKRMLKLKNYRTVYIAKMVKIRI